MVSIHDPDASTVAATNSFDREALGEEHDIILDCSFGDSEGLCKGSVCVMPDSAQALNDPLPAFMGIHGPSPFLPAPYVECNS